MLIRCPQCGKPVYMQTYRLQEVECGFCYRTFRIQDTEIIKPDNQAWKEPLRNAAQYGDHYLKYGKWLEMLGETENAERIVRERTEQIQKSTARWLLETERDKENSSGENGLPSTKIRDWISEGWRLMEEYRQIPEDKRDSHVEERLQEGMKDLQIRKIGSIRKNLKNDWSLEKLENDLKELKSLRDYPGAEEGIQEAEKLREEWIQRNKEAEERMRRRQRRLKWIRAAAVAAVLLALVGIYGAVNYIYFPGQLKKVRALFEAGEYERAEAVGKHLVYNVLNFNAETQAEAEIILSESRVMLGDRLAAEGKWQEALKKYEEARNEVKAAEAHLQYGNQLAAEENWKDAITEYGDAGDKKKLAEAHLRYGDQLAAEENWKDAITEYGDAGDKKKLAEAHLRYGDQLAAEENWKDAITEYGDAGDKEKLAEAHLRYGDQLAAKQLWDRAIEEYEASGCRDKAKAAYRQYGDQLAAVGLLKAAVSEWKKVPIKGDELSDLYADWVAQYVEQEQFQTAIDAFQDPVEGAVEKLEREYLTVDRIYLYWGMAYMRQGYKKRAVETLRRAEKTPIIRKFLKAWVEPWEDELIAAAVEVWEDKKGTEETKQDAMAEIRRMTREITTLEGNLRLCQALDEKGVVLKEVFPEGLRILDLMENLPPAKGKGEMNIDRPLVVLRRQEDIRFERVGSGNEETVISIEGKHEWRLLPELWQRLPEERRASDSRAWTCLLIIDMSYQKAREKMVYRTARIPIFDQKYEIILWDPKIEKRVSCGRYQLENNSFQDEVIRKKQLPKIWESLNSFFRMKTGKVLKLTIPFTWVPIQSDLENAYEKLIRGEEMK